MTRQLPVRSYPLCPVQRVAQLAPRCKRALPSRMNADLFFKNSDEAVLDLGLLFLLGHTLPQE